MWFACTVSFSLGLAVGMVLVALARDGAAYSAIRGNAFRESIASGLTSTESHQEPMSPEEWFEKLKASGELEPAKREEDLPPHQRGQLVVFSKGERRIIDTPAYAVICPGCDSWVAVHVSLGWRDLPPNDEWFTCHGCQREVLNREREKLYANGRWQRSGWPGPEASEGDLVDEGGIEVPFAHMAFQFRDSSVLQKASRIHPSNLLYPWLGEPWTDSGKGNAADDSLS